jgi:DNA relaxase NicK
VKTTIDWLAFRCQDNPWRILESMASVWAVPADLVTFQPGARGKDGWLYAGQIMLAGDVVLGRIDYGGTSQRGWVRVNISGEGCGWIQDWDAVERLQHVLTSATIKRLDIALTTFKGEVTDQLVLEAHQAGKFTAGGRPPVMTHVGSSDPRAGRTRYIGSRKSHKFLRCYEKGFELLKDCPRSVRDETTHINGDRVEEIYRVELELKDVDKLIPWECIRGRDSIFASAYPFCAELLPGLPTWRMANLPSFKAEASLDAGLDNCRMSYGRIMRAALEAYGGDKVAVIDRVLAESPSPRLVELGVLTLERQGVVPRVRTTQAV